jgi:RNA polymerase sigma-70 factor (sigma-E family)
MLTDTHSPLTDTVATAGRRDRAASFAMVFEEYHHRALRFAGLLYGDRTRAEDAVSEAFARIWRRYQRGDVEAMWPYLRTALSNGFRTGLRRRVLERREEERQAHRPITVSNREGRLDDRAVLLAALQQLPERQRAAVVLRYFEDLSEADTAAILGCSIGTVKASVSRGLSRLHGILGDTVQEDPR